MSTKTNRSYIIHSSALLKVITTEPENEEVMKYLDNCYMSVIDATECLIVLNKGGMPIEVAKQMLESLVPKFMYCDYQDSEAVVAIVNSSSEELALSDGYCLALAEKLQLPVVTAKPALDQAKTNVEVICI